MEKIPFGAPSGIKSPLGTGMGRNSFPATGNGAGTGGGGVGGDGDGDYAPRARPTPLPSLPGGWLMPLPNIERTTFRHYHNLSYFPGDEELARPAPPIPHPSFSEPSSFSQPSNPNYPYIGTTLRSIQEEQASLLAYVASEWIC